MKEHRLRLVLGLVLVVLLIFTACSSGGIAGTYKMVEGPVGVTVTFGKEGSFVFSSGAEGTYEVNGNTVLLRSGSFGGVVLKKDGDTLVGDSWRLERQK
jgi:hypothetical protein